MRPTVKRVLGFGIVAAAGYAMWRAFEVRRSDSNVTWQPQPFPYPPVPRTSVNEPASDDQASAARETQIPGRGDGAADTDREPESAAGTTWVEPDGSTCPVTHPVKGKLSSGIFHVPGGANYERTNPDRCYTDAPAAEADGLRAAKA